VAGATKRELRGSSGAKRGTSEREGGAALRGFMGMGENGIDIKGVRGGGSANKASDPRPKRTGCG
jgi:hypothetical protein